MKKRIDKYIRIEPWGESATGRTRVWRVFNFYHGVDCGRIKWWGGFRKYCFFPMDEHLLYDSDCLRAVAEFLDDINKKHRREAMKVL